MNLKKISKQFDAALVHLKRLRLETLYILIFLTFGVIFTVIIPPGWNTDETNHVYRIYQISEGDILSEKVVDPQTGLRAYGGLVPTNLVRLFDQTGAGEPGTVGNPQYKITSNLYKTQPDITKLKDDGRRSSMNFSGAALYSPASYAIYLPVFWLGRLLALPLFWIIILSRLVGLMVTGLAFFLAIKYIPIGKWILFAVGLIPSVVVQATTVGADAPQMALIILFITYITRLIYLSKQPTAGQYVIMTALGTLLALTKMAYAPIILLVLLAPLLKQEYRTRKAFILSAAAIIISLTPGLIWTHLVAYININSNPQANFGRQKMFVFGHPVTYLRTLYQTFFTNAQPLTVANMFGSFIWDSVALPALYAYFSAFSVFSSLFVKGRREVSMSLLPWRERRLWRLSLLTITVVTGLLIATALYVYSTTLKGSSIVGLQSRYFLPLSPLILLAFYGNTLKNQRVVKIGIVVVSCIVLIGAVLVVYARLYQTLPLVIT